MLSDNYMDAMRKVGDSEADALIQRVIQEKNETHLFDLLQSNSATIKKRRGDIEEFLFMPLSLPTWHNERRLKQGQLFFKKFAFEIMTLLGTLSLPYCYAATPGNKAIYITGKLKRAPGKRLLETAQFIINVLDHGSFDAGGSGSFETQRTRLVHAFVRHRVAQGPDWNSDWGVPVNQEDMAGTNLAFSYIVLKGLQKLNFKMHPQEQKDFLFAWRFIGHQLRIQDPLLAESLDEARSLEQLIMKRNFRKSKEGMFLTQDLLQHYEKSLPTPAGLFVESQMRYFLGPEVAHYLGLTAHPIRDSVVSGAGMLQQAINSHFVNPYSYDMMITNHQKLRELYSHEFRASRSIVKKLPSLR